MEIYRLAKFSSISLELGDFYLPPTLPPLIDIILRSSQDSSEETFARLAGMVTPQGHEHHVSSRIRNFTIILWICWTARFKIHKDLYGYPQDLWPVTGPSQGPNNDNKPPSNFKHDIWIRNHVLIIAS